MSLAALLILSLAVSQTPAAAEPNPEAAPPPADLGSPAAEASPTPPPAPPKAEAPSNLPLLTLKQALDLAEERNFDMQILRSKLEQSKEISKKVWSNYLPQLSTGASYTRNEVGASITLPTGYWLRDMSGAPAGTFDKTKVNGPPFDPTKGAPSTPPDISNPPGVPSSTIMIPSGLITADLQKVNMLGAQIQFNQAILAPALWPAIHNAYLAQDLVAFNVENGRRELLFAVAQVYYGAASLREAVKVQKELLENLKEHERDAKVRVEAGTAPRIILIRAQIDRVRGEADVVRAEANLASAKIALSTLLDRDTQFELSSPEQIPVPLPPQAESTDIGKRPDVQAAKANAELADGQQTAVWYRYAPSVGFRWTYQLANVQGFTGRYGTWAAMVGLNWTLWDGGLRESDLRETTEKAVEARAAERKLVVQARDEVKRSALDLKAAEANRVKAEEQAKLARENMRLVQVNFANGVATALDVHDANVALANAEIGYVADTLNTQLSALRLAKAAGLFTNR